MHKECSSLCFIRYCFDVSTSRSFEEHA